MLAYPPSTMQMARQHGATNKNGQGTIADGNILVECFRSAHMQELPPKLRAVFEDNKVGFVVCRQIVFSRSSCTPLLRNTLSYQSLGLVTKKRIEGAAS